MKVKRDSRESLCINISDFVTILRHGWNIDESQSTYQLDIDPVSNRDYTYDVLEGHQVGRGGRWTVDKVKAATGEERIKGQTALRKQKQNLLRKHAVSDLEE